jgi:hypothetical protein
MIPFQMGEGCFRPIAGRCDDFFGLMTVCFNVCENLYLFGISFVI